MSVFKYHVTVNEGYRDIFEVEDKEKLVTEVIARFGLSPDDEYNIQIWNTEFEDWCLTDASQLPDKAKVRFVMKLNKGSNGNPIQLQDDGHDHPPSTPSQATADADDTTDNHSMKLSTSLRPWPVKFSLPISRFPRTLAEALNGKKPIVRGLLSQLTTCIYEEMTKYTFYPTSAQYTEMSKALLTKFPYLGQDLPGTDAVTLWKHTIEYKVRNSRKRLDMDVPVVHANKKKVKRQETGDGAHKQQKNQWGVKNFLPMRPVEEDDHSINNHLNWMKVESQKTSQNEPKISLLLKKTFPDRRRLVVTELATVVKIKEEFPCLFCSREILNEFEHITELRIERLILEGVAKYQDAIFSVAKPSVLKASVVKAIGDIKEPSQRNAVKAQGALLLVPQLMGENLNMLAIVKDQMQPALQHPMFSYTEDLFNPEVDHKTVVHVEGVDVSEPLCVLDAIAEVMACYYIFNIAYPKEMFKSLTFYQRIIANLQDTTSIPAKVLTVTKKLNNYLSTQI